MGVRKRETADAKEANKSIVFANWITALLHLEKCVSSD
jgi:hypothetical protein